MEGWGVLAIDGDVPLKTYPMLDNCGETISFEVNVVAIGLRQMVKLLNDVDGVSIRGVRPLFGGMTEGHIQFEYGGIPCRVWEPFGDNSRYLIGPNSEPPDGWHLSAVEDAFKRYKPRGVRRLLASLYEMQA